MKRLRDQQGAEVEGPDRVKFRTLPAAGSASAAAPLEIKAEARCMLKRAREVTAAASVPRLRAPSSSSEESLSDESDGAL